jgi:hypothetical protein
VVFDRSFLSKLGEVAKDEGFHRANEAGGDDGDVDALHDGEAKQAF